MTRPHVAALVTRLESDELADCVYWEKQVPRKNGAETVTKYLRVRANNGLRTSERLAAPYGPIRLTFWLTGVGTSPGQAAWVLEQATDVLLNWAPTVAGWSCRRMEPVASQPVDMDPDVDNRFFGVDQWDLFAEPRLV